MAESRAGMSCRARCDSRTSRCIPPVRSTPPQRMRGRASVAGTRYAKGRSDRAQRAADRPQLRLNNAEGHRRRGARRSRPLTPQPRRGRAGGVDRRQIPARAPRIGERPRIGSAHEGVHMTRPRRGDLLVKHLAHQQRAGLPGAGSAGGRATQARRYGANPVTDERKTRLQQSFNSEHTIRGSNLEDDAGRTERKCCLRER